MFSGVLATPLNHCTKMKFSIKDFFSKCEQIRSCLRIWSHLPKKSLMENFILSAVNASVVYKTKMKRFSLNQLISKMVSLDTPIFRFQSNMLKSTQQELNKNFERGSSCILKIKYFQPGVFSIKIMPNKHLKWSFLRKQLTVESH